MPITVGTVEVEVVPTTRGITRRLRQDLLPAVTQVGQEAGREMGDRMVAALRQQVSTSASSIGQQLGQQIAARMQAEIRGALRSAVVQGGRQAQAQASRSGGDVGGAFARSMRTRIEAAIRSLPDITIGANTTEAEADIQALRARLETLSSRRIGVDLDAAQAIAEAEQIEAELRRIGASHPNVQIRTDTASARAALAEFRAELERLNRTSASPRVEVDGGFAQRLRASVQAAQAQLPDINIGANTAAAAAEVQALRGRLEALRDVRVGIDVDAATALAQINDVQARLTALAASDATVDVRVDAAAAAAQLAAVQAQVNALDGDTARIDIDVSSAAAGLVRLTTLAAGIGPAIVPAMAAATFGVGAFTSVLAAAGVGAGAFAAAAAPGLIGVGKAVQATTAAQEALAAAQDKTARSGAAQAIQAQQQALTMASAQQALASAQRSRAEQIADAQGRVRDAIRGVADAQDQAAQRMDAALDRITAADRQRTAALRDQEQAQKDLLEAQEAAARQAEDLAARRAGGALAERSAVLAVEKAQKDLEEVRRSGANANSLEAREAQLSYDQAVQRLADQRRENARLAEDAKAGNRGVQQAEENLARAKERTADAARAVADAHKNAERTQIEGARAVARAQEQVAEAQQGVVRAQQQGADAVASAQRQIASAQLAAAASAAQQAAGVEAANTALDKQARALAELSPAQRGVYDAVQRLKDGFKAWGEQLAPATMPLVTRFLDALTGMLPGLTPLVLAAADGLNRLGDRARGAFQDPFWDRFRQNLAENIPRAIESLGVAFGNVFAGMAGIVNAFLPKTDEIGSSMERVTARFRDWGQNLDQSQGFRDFTDTVSRTWPAVRDVLSDVADALGQLGSVLLNISPSAVLILQGIAMAIAATPVWVIQTLINAFFAYKVAVFAMAAAQAVYVGAMTLYSTVTALATTATWSFSAALRAVSSANFIVFLLTIIGTFALLMIQSEGFRNKVIGVFQEIGSWATWLWRNAFQPAFSAIGAAAVWLWENAIRPAFEGISLAARILAAVVATILVAPLLIGFALLSAAATFLWEYAIGPAFRRIAEDATWLWRTVLEPFFRTVWGLLQWVGDKAMWLWSGPISSAFSLISAAADALWTRGLKPPLDLAVGGFQNLGQWAQNTYNTVSEWFGKIGEKVGEVLGKFGPAFGGAKEAVRLLWEGVDGIGEIAARPVRFIVDKVYMDGIRKVWNFVINAVGLGSLALPEAKFARGGVVGGYAPGVDSVHAMLSPGEGVLVPEAVRALGPGWVHGINAHYSRGRSSGGTSNRFAGGGIVGHGAVPMGGNFFDPRDWDDLAGDAIDWAKKGLGAAYEGLKDVPGLGDAIQWAEDLVRGAAAEAAERMLRPVAGWAGEGIANAAVGTTRIAGATISRDAPWAKALREAPGTLIDKLVARIRQDDAEQQSLGGIWVKPADGSYGAKFGQAGPMWASGKHTGLDILAPAGADVRAVAAGQVASALSGGPYGNHILLNHAGGLQSLYAHLSSMLVSFGDAVARGQKIGTVGSTGNSTGPHLHLEARQWFQDIDPMQFLEPAAGGKAAPPGQVRDWIIQGLSVVGQGNNQAWINGLYTIAMRESGGNPRAINLWDCLTLDAMILTRRGWLRHDEVRVGDETIGYNAATGKSEWTRITAVVHYEDAPLVRLSNSRWETVSTPNHRWLSQPRINQPLPAVEGDACPSCEWPQGTRRRGKTTAGGLRIHMAKAHGVRSAPRESTYGDARFVTTESLRSRDRLLLAAAADTEDGLSITDSEAAILGWIAGDGHIETRAHRPTISIAQSKPDMVEKLRALLKEVPHAEYVDHRSTRLGNEPCGSRYQFRLDHDWANDLVRRVGHPKDNAIAIVLAMSSSQRTAWLEAFGDAEGTVDDRGRVLLYQAPGPVLEAAALALYLSGRRPRIGHVDRAERPETWQREAWVVGNTPVVAVSGLKREDAGSGDVWCVTTELGSWTARQGDHIFLTGNSNAAKGTPSKGLLQFIDPTFREHALAPYLDIWNPVHQVIADWFYINSRYGGIQNVQQANPSKAPKGYSLGGVVPYTYDSGGYLPPGLNLTYNGTGRPEAVLTARQEAALSGALRGGDGAGVFTGSLFLDSGEFLGVVNGQIDRRQTAVAGRLNAGPTT